MKILKYLLPTLLLIGNAALAQNSLNLENNYAPVRSVMLGGGGNVVCIGDSLSYGVYFTNIQNLMQSTYGNGGQGYVGISRWTNAGVNPNFIEGAINQDIIPYRGMDGLWLSHESATTTSAFIRTTSEVAELIYVAGPECGNFLFVPSNGNAVNVNANDTEENIAIQVFNSVIGAQNWIYPSVNGRVTLLGVNNRNASPGVVLHRAANGGWGVNNFLQRDWSFDRICQYLQPDLYLVMLGQNDGNLGQSVYENKLLQLHFRLKFNNPNSKIIFISSYNSGSPNGLAHSIAMRNVAEQRGDGFIDLYTVGGNHQFYADNGYLEPDQIHFSPAGGAYVAGIIFNALESYGDSLIECDSIDFNQDGIHPDTQDIDEMLSVFSGGPCLSCLSTPDLDFNNDNLVPDTSDIDSFLSVFAGGPCLR